MDPECPRGSDIQFSQSVIHNAKRPVSPDLFRGISELPPAHRATVGTTACTRNANVELDARRSRTKVERAGANRRVQGLVEDAAAVADEE